MFNVASKCKTGIYFEKCKTHLLAYGTTVFTVSISNIISQWQVTGQDCRT